MELAQQAPTWIRNGPRTADMIDSAVSRLIAYGTETGLLPEDEEIYARNLVLDVIGKDDFTDDGVSYKNVDLESTLNELLDYAASQGVIEDTITDRDLLDTKIMNCLTPRPAEVVRGFREKYEVSPKDATDYYYKLSQDSDYIRRYRIKKDRHWTVPTEYGDIEISINLSKPEKDPKAIAAAGAARQTGYPRCQLCIENEGYAGRADHPARETLRLIPIEIAGSQWKFQYSPYTYYNEHCIALNNEHVPMKIDHDTFVKLFDFIEIFPHYFIGSNADLPIVGGSILSHDHFQGGNHEFAMAKAPIEESFEVDGYQDVSAGIVKWPMSVIRLRGKSRDRVIELADRILDKWRAYTDEEAFIFAETDGEPHNTITPVARRRGEEYELDLVLRNNITTKERPYGVYHPPEELHHIKKENIGLIEVMGLAILPARLRTEMDRLAEILAAGDDPRKDKLTEKHADWAEQIAASHPELNADNASAILQQEIGAAFSQVLEAAGVFKRDEAGKEAFRRFVEEIQSGNA